MWELVSPPEGGLTWAALADSGWVSGSITKQQHWLYSNHPGPRHPNDMRIANIYFPISHVLAAAISAGICKIQAMKCA